MNGPITNNNPANQILSIPIFSGANATYNGGTGGLTFNSLSLETNTAVSLTTPIPAIVQTTGTITVTGGLVFQLNSNSSTNLSATSGYSQIIQNSGTFNASGGQILLSGPYTGNAGDVFQLVTAASGGTVSLPTSVDTTTDITLSSNINAVSTLIKKGIEFFEPSTSSAAGGGNLINAGVVLPIGNDSEFNTKGTAAFNVTLNGGELLTANNNTNLDTGGTNGLAYTTSNLIGVNTTGGTIASAAGDTATYNGVIANGNGSTGALTIGDATTGGTGTVVFNGANTYTGGTIIGAGTAIAGVSNATTVSGAFGATNGTTRVGDPRQCGNNDQ